MTKTRNIQTVEAHRLANLYIYAGELADLAKEYKVEVRANIVHSYDKYLGRCAEFSVSVGKNYFRYIKNCVSSPEAYRKSLRLICDAKARVVTEANRIDSEIEALKVKMLELEEQRAHMSPVNLPNC